LRQKKKSAFARVVARNPVVMSKRTGRLSFAAMKENEILEEELKMRKRLSCDEETEAEVTDEMSKKMKSFSVDAKSEIETVVG
jgi:type II secretory pathway component PulJ